MSVTEVLLKLGRIRAFFCFHRLFLFDKEKTLLFECFVKKYIFREVLKVDVLKPLLLSADLTDDFAEF